ncbi:MAG: YfiR family protein [Flavobacteriales bacterium]|nr:YfiR family protein [Flavobacteriales bacterium]
MAKHAAMLFRTGPLKRPQQRLAHALRIPVAVVLALLCWGGMQVQREPDKDTIAIIEASYIYNVAKLVQWNDPKMREGPFVIGVMGSGNRYQELLNKYATRTIGKQPIEVRKLPRAPVADRCHILFIQKEDRPMLAESLKQGSTSSTLIVTEWPEALAEGAVVNFIPANKTLKYEISLSNAQRHHIEVGLTLRQLAERVVE